MLRGKRVRAFDDLSLLQQHVALLLYDVPRSVACLVVAVPVVVLAQLVVVVLLL